MGGLRNFDLFGSIWCISLACAYTFSFIRNESILEEAGTPLSEMSLLPNLYFYSSLAIALLAAIALFFRNFLWAVIGLVFVKTSFTFILSFLKTSPNSLPVSEWFRLTAYALLVMALSYYVLKWRRKKQDFEAEKNLQQEFQ